MMSSGMTIAACTTATLALCASVLADEPAATRPKPASVAERIAYYQKQVAAHPKHYPAYSRLGSAWLDNARQAYDPAALAQARNSLKQSLAIQPNYEALHGLAAAANYSHRFAEALDWCRQAAATAPQDKSVVAMQVEALLGLGRFDEATAIAGSGEASDFYTAAARGHCHSAAGRREQAAAAFGRAAELASQRQDLAVWATTTAAGVWLDSGDLAKARPLLDAAAKLDAGDSFLRIHFAELAEAEGRPAEALRIYEELLKTQVDPELHRRAAGLARQLGRAESAESHFAAAEKLCLRAGQSGEFYGLETLANLYCDAQRRPSEALRLAEQNLEHKRDAGAKETLARARAFAGK
jgi:tetratricopeptide (TPR) repeat protein